jgi:hypothetical protein
VEAAIGIELTNKVFADRKFGFAILTNANRAHPHLFKLGDRATDLLNKYTSVEKAATHQ